MQQHQQVDVEGEEAAAMTGSWHASGDAYDGMEGAEDDAVDDDFYHTGEQGHEEQEEEDGGGMPGWEACDD